MSVPREQAPGAPRRLPFWWLLGVAALAVSALGATWAFNNPAGAVPPEGPETPLRPGSVIATGFADAEHGVVPLYPLQPGRVAEVLARDGKNVKAGEMLFRLDDEAARKRVLQAEAVLRAAELQLNESKKLPAQHKEKLTQQREAITAAQSEAAATRATHARLKNLFAKQLSGVSAEEVTAAEKTVEAKEALVRLQESRLRELNLVDPDFETRKAEADVDGKRAKVEEARVGVKEYVVTAPSDGTVLRMLTNPGEALGATPRQPAVLFVPAGPRIVRAEVDQEWADRVAVGQVAFVQDETNTTTRYLWRGRVARVADWYTQRRSSLGDPTQFQDVRTLEVIIELAPNQPPLRIGQRVRVTLEPLARTP